MGKRCLKGCYRNRLLPVQIKAKEKRATAIRKEDGEGCLEAKENPPCEKQQGNGDKHIEGDHR